jgi:hypothetical protein
MGKNANATLLDADRKLFRDVIDLVNSEEPPQPAAMGFANWWATQRSDIRDDFEYLATNGRLSPEAAQWAVDMFKDHVIVEPVITMKTGHAVITYIPRFKNLEGSVAYVLLRLSQVDDVSFGVCRKCGDLWFDDRKGKGRKREGFCSDAHRLAFTQAVYRKNAVKAARHK